MVVTNSYRAKDYLINNSICVVEDNMIRMINDRDDINKTLVFVSDHTHISEIRPNDLCLCIEGVFIPRTRI